MDARVFCRRVVKPYAKKVTRYGKPPSRTRLRRSVATVITNFSWPGAAGGRTKRLAFRSRPRNQGVAGAGDLARSTNRKLLSICKSRPPRRSRSRGLHREDKRDLQSARGGAQIINPRDGNLVRLAEGRHAIQEAMIVRRDRFRLLDCFEPRAQARANVALKLIDGNMLAPVGRTNCARLHCAINVP